jgi:hypothetical protein
LKRSGWSASSMARLGENPAPLVPSIGRRWP